MPVKSFGGGSPVKSIQRGISGPNLNQLDVTITGVDVTKSIVKLVGYFPNNTSGNNSNQILPRIVILNSTTLRIIFGATPSGSVWVSWEVIEFASVKSIQSGISSQLVGTGGISATISAVSLTKSLVFYSYNMASDPTDTALLPTLIYASLASSTQLNFSRQVNTYKTDITWYVVEFN